MVHWARAILIIIIYKWRRLAAKVCFIYMSMYRIEKMHAKMLDSGNAFESSSFVSSSFGKKFFSNSPLSVKYVRSKTDVPGVIVSCWKNFLGISTNK